MPEHDTIVGPLQTSVHERLEDFARLSDSCDDEEAADLARREIPLLVQALRSALSTHEPDARGRCPVCRDRGLRSLFRRRGRRLPCRAYLAVQLRLGPLDKASPRHSHARHQHRRRAHLYSVS